MELQWEEEWKKGESGKDLDPSTQIMLRLQSVEMPHWLLHCPRGVYASRRLSLRRGQLREALGCRHEPWPQLVLPMLVELAAVGLRGGEHAVILHDEGYVDCV